jgi:hypothetical protein
MNGSPVRLALIIGLGVLAAGLAGCSSTPKPPDYGSDDGKAIALLIEEVNDCKADGKRLAQLFAEPVKDLKKYDPYNYDLSGKPVVSGETATAKLKVRADDGTEKGTTDWTFVKAGDKWKIQSAPLP